jgi:hypothetical protein
LEQQFLPVAAVAADEQVAEGEFLRQNPIGERKTQRRPAINAKRK